jgi:hypothetical protein
MSSVKHLNLPLCVPNVAGLFEELLFGERRSSRASERQCDV